MRDRIGIKPLYYSRPPRPADASRPRSRRCSTDPAAAARRRRGGALPLPLVPDDAGAADAVRGHQEAARRHVAARRAPTATIARAALLGRLGPRRRRSTGVSEDEIAERVLDELRTSVQLRKVSDVPVGVFLSGGIDSSTNAALFSEGESSAGQDVLDRLRGRVRHATRTSSTTRARWRSASAPSITSGR